MSLLLQLELNKPKKSKAQSIYKLPIADRRRITQEKLKMGKMKEFEKVQEFVKAF